MVCQKFGEKGMMVVDESTAIKNRKANRTKAIVAAGKFSLTAPADWLAGDKVADGFVFAVPVSGRQLLELP